ncbi:metal-dependent hydrolase family protein [Spelaeicoccus albus]|uniref:Imidazolonepropionase-like amidohydrolase n=1 Tax=Spelaeicoccus albus TaxID=1280376 RepID=A0A7Z0A9G0_9MICO|nr:amidohydrolase family protein [Spelaeicoccus albus]NYI66862.1 imidazolonepropionase-like amidohydrolase [Spelaeicoccus albus]
MSPVHESLNANLLIRHATVLDPVTGKYSEHDVRISDGVVVETGAKLTAPDDVRTLDAGGRYVLPGLIDAHVHVTAATADLGSLTSWSPSYVAFQAGRLMSDMLDRGFTTVRDCSGADFGLHDAQAEGLLRGPRLFFCGKALSQTGGHGDSRPRGASVSDSHQCCAGLGRVADGVDAVRAAARDELRKGAHHIKVMGSGGVASPTDRVDSTQYSMDELRAIVDEAEAANRYVTAHAYTARAVNRALRAGIRGIEHGNLIDDESISLLTEHEAFLVPTLVTYWSLQREGREFGLPQDSWEKVSEVLDAGLRGLELAARGTVNIAYGTDLLGGMQRHQSREFQIRADVQPAIDVIRSATVNAADLLQRTGELGVLRPGAHGDALIVDDDPLDNISVLAEGRIDTVIQGGSVVAERR